MLVKVWSTQSIWERDLCLGRKATKVKALRVYGLNRATCMMYVCLYIHELDWWLGMRLWCISYAWHEMLKYGMMWRLENMNFWAMTIWDYDCMLLMMWIIWCLRWLYELNYMLSWEIILSTVFEYRSSKSGKLSLRRVAMDIYEYVDLDHSWEGCVWVETE